MIYGSQWFESAFEARGEAVAVSDSARSSTAVELGERARSLASWIAQHRPRSVAIDTDAGVDWLVALHAIWLAGASAIPVGSRAGDPVRSLALDRADLIVDSAAIATGSGPGPVSADLPGVRGPMAPAVLLFTSGSTSEPSEVLLSHGNLIAQATASRRALDGGPGDRWLSTLPVDHTGGLTVPVRCSVWGAEAVLRPRFDAAEALELLMDPAAGITIVSLVPTMLLRLLDLGLQRPPSLRRAVVSGAPFPAELRERALAAGIPVVESWGMTETTGMACVEREPGEGGCGRPLEGVHIETSDTGEIRVGGPTVSPGVMVGGMFDTGDLGEIRDGRLHPIGRLGSMIITGGNNVSPERVEDVVRAHPAVGDCICFGAPDSEWGEVVCVDVVLAGEVSVEDLHAWCRERLAPWENPRRMRFVDAIPLTRSGKPDRRAAAGR